jgi:hypothetical protein
MLPLLANRVREISITAGTGTIALLGVDRINSHTFVEKCGTGQLAYYTIVHRAEHQWETGIGTLTAGAPDTLSRDVVLDNHLGTTAKVNFLAGMKDVFEDIPAQRMATYEEGTYVPVLSGAGTLPTFTTVEAHWTRIGRWCQFQILLNNTTGGTPGNGSGQLGLSLPFTAGSEPSFIRIPIGSGQNGTVAHVVFGAVAASQNVMLLSRLEEAGNDPILIALMASNFNHADIRQLTVAGSMQIV